MSFDDERFQIQDITTTGFFTALFHVIITAYQLDEIYFLSRVFSSLGDAADVHSVVPR